MNSHSYACPLVTAALLWTSCHGHDERFVPASDPRIVYTGRFDTTVPDAVRAAWPGSQIEARFSGTAVHAQLLDTPSEDETRDTDWITVVLDAGPPKTFALSEGLHSYPLATGLRAGAHHVLIWKRTEAEVGVITFRGFQLAAQQTLLPPPKAPLHQLLVVGDSITTGTGNEGADSSCHWSAKAENNYASYGAYAARELKASYTAIAYGGKGLTRNYEARDRLTLPMIYDRVIPTEDDSPLASSAPLADVVVLNVGTNDWFAGVPNEASFTQAYDELLEKLRKQNPAALLVMALGPMLADNYPQPNARKLTRHWMQAVQARRQARGDQRIDFIELWIRPHEGTGCDFHPNKTTHARLGHELAELIRARLGW